MPPKLPFEQVLQRRGNRIGLFRDDLPDRKGDLEGWVKGMDTISRERFDPSKPHTPHILSRMDSSAYAEIVTEGYLTEYLAIKRRLTTNLMETSENIIVAFTEEDFENKWLGLGVQGQHKYLLEGYKNYEFPMDIDSDPPSFHYEIRYSEMIRDGGRGFLDLLRLCILPNPHVPPEDPIILKNERYDEILGWREDNLDPKRKARLYGQRVTRMCCINSFIRVILRVWRGWEPSQKGFLLPQRIKAKDSLAGDRLGKELLKEYYGRERSKEWRKEYVKYLGDQKLHCHSCDKVEDPDVTGKMHQCVRCRKIGRAVRYCDKACQRQDWPAHKPTCGRHYTAEDFMTPAIPARIRGNSVTPRPDIPPPNPGFIRSPHLAEQIRHLNTNADWDYIVFAGSVDSAQMRIEGLEYETQLDKASIFICLRNRILRTDQNVEDAMRFVYRCLADSQGSTVTSTVIREQLAKEYGEVWKRAWKKEQDPNEKVLKIDWIERDEIDHALQWLKEAERFKDKLKLFAPGLGPAINVDLTFGKNDDIQILVEFPGILAKALFETSSEITAYQAPIYADK